MYQNPLLPQIASLGVSVVLSQKTIHPQLNPGVYVLYLLYVFCNGRLWGQNKSM